MPMFRRDPRDQRPETLSFSKFDGVKNTVGEERLGPADLVRAQNIDLDDVGQPRRRRGRTKVLDGDFHSACTIPGGMYAVKDGVLGHVSTDYTFTPIVSGAGPKPIAYVTVGEQTYFSSEDINGILSGMSVSPWGAIGPDGLWYSPVVSPTATLAPVKGKLLGDPPKATSLAYLNGRIWAASRRLVWATEPYLYGVVDRTKNFLQFEADNTFMAAVDDGIFIGTETAVYFLQAGQFPPKRMPILDVGAIAGSAVAVPGELINLGTPAGAVQEAKAAVMFMTEAGLCVGMNGGVCYNLTQTRVIFPDAVRAAAMFRRQDGVNQYVSVLDSGGSPVSNARIGDYLDAEIVRFRGA